MSKQRASHTAAMIGSLALLMTGTPRLVSAADSDGHPTDIDCESSDITLDTTGQVGWSARWSDSTIGLGGSPQLIFKHPAPRTLYLELLAPHPDEPMVVFVEATVHCAVPPGVLVGHLWGADWSVSADQAPLKDMFRTPLQSLGNQRYAVQFRVACRNACTGRWVNLKLSP